MQVAEETERLEELDKAAAHFNHSFSSGSIAREDADGDGGGDDGGDASAKDQSEEGEAPQAPDGKTPARAVAVAAGEGRNSNSDAEVEAAVAMERVRSLTEALYEEMLRHHDLEVGHSGTSLFASGLTCRSFLTSWLRSFSLNIFLAL
jgi:hypothetical protein